MDIRIYQSSPTEGKMVEELNQYIAKQKETLDVLKMFYVIYN